MTWFSLQTPKTRVLHASRPKHASLAAQMSWTKAKDTLASRTFQGHLLTQYFIIYIPVGRKYYTSSTLPQYVVKTQKTILPNFSKHACMPYTVYS